MTRFTQLFPCLLTLALLTGPVHGDDGQAAGETAPSANRTEPVTLDMLPLKHYEQMTPEERRRYEQLSPSQRKRHEQLRQAERKRLKAQRQAELDRQRQQRREARQPQGSEATKAATPAEAAQPATE
ncbi:hypothetical protein [Marinobacterium arenosum]|uniref:hypothetical protein n=1 Tax=Marinobacterium arenosum TaxID=2862496 RepID=UPI001C95A2DD|nr:hypothetical protein [Marinobacterium arenosum]MBY4675811.1 hypothetical protein [Marinobacterium arenosum]